MTECSQLTNQNSPAVLNNLGFTDYSDLCLQIILNINTGYEHISNVYWSFRFSLTETACSNSFLKFLFGFLLGYFFPIDLQKLLFI